MYREVIEHPLSLPAEIKMHLDLTSGRDYGRIYRIVPEGPTVKRDMNLCQLSTERLVQLLADQNAWHRETAARTAVSTTRRRCDSAVAPIGQDQSGGLGTTACVVCSSRPEWS